MKSPELHRLIARVYRQQHKYAAPLLADLGITSGQPRILRYLSTHNGCIQNEFSTHFDLEPATVTNILTGMEKLGLIIKQSDSSDRRVQRIFLTEKGVLANEMTQEVIAAIENRCFEGFSDEEKDLSMDFLNRIYENLKKSDKEKIDV